MRATVLVRSIVVSVALAACARRAPTPSPAPPPLPSPPATPCPEGMALVQDRFCIDRWEASLVETGSEGKPFSPFISPGHASVRAVSRPDVMPQGYISRDQAVRACEASSKRLCNDDEWVTACRGDPPHAYPYGDERHKGVCNDMGISPLRVYFQAAEMYQPGPMNDPRLNQTPRTVAQTGEFTGCTNGFGVFDMVGNLHEWVMSPKPTFRGGYFQDTKINGEGCSYRTTAHGASYHDYSTGFRCCATPTKVPGQ